MQPADPSSRSGCTSTGLVVGRPITTTCQNVTLAQFADELNRNFNIAATGRRVVDETGIRGAWNVSLAYRLTAPRAVEAGVAAVPAGEATSPFEAIERQLGLKLVEATVSVDAMLQRSVRGWNA